MLKYYVLVLIALACVPTAKSAASWAACITAGATCSTDCINAGYPRDQTTNLCKNSPYTYCYSTSVSLPGVCDSTQPNYYLQACIDYGFTKNTSDGSCVPPVCIDGVSACSTTTTYCADQGYTNVSGLCACASPYKDWMGRCTNILHATILRYLTPLLIVTLLIGFM